MRTAWAALGALVVVGVLYGCSSFGANDASNPEPDANPNPNPSPDADATPEPMVDAGADVSDGAVSFCQGKTGFCDDFERATPTPGPGWQATFAGGAKLAIENIGQKSARGLLATQMAGVDNQAFVQRLVDAGPTQMSLSASIRFDDTVVSAILMGFDYDILNSTAVQLSTSPGAINLVEVGTDFVPIGKPINTPPTNVFVDYKLSVDLMAHTASAYVNGQLAQSIMLTHGQTNVYVAKVGNLFSGSANTGGKVRFDNVLIEFGQ